MLSQSRTQSYLHHLHAHTYNKLNFIHVTCVLFTYSFTLIHTHTHTHTLSVLYCNQTMKGSERESKKECQVLQIMHITNFFKSHLAFHHFFINVFLLLLYNKARDCRAHNEIVFNYIAHTKKHLGNGEVCMCVLCA